MSPMKKPKLSVHAKMMKNPKITFSRFMRPLVSVPPGQRQHAAFALHVHPVQKAHAEKRHGKAVAFHHDRIDTVQRDTADADDVELHLASAGGAVGGSHEHRL